MKRYWFPLSLLVLVAAFAIYLFATNHFARYFVTVLLSLLAFALILIWHLLRRGVGWKSKLGLLGVLVVAPILFFSLFRIDGFSGAGYPVFALRSSQAAGSGLAALQGTASDPTSAGTVSFNFAGPNRDNMLPTRAFGTDWTANPPVELWRRDIGSGWGSFAIAGGRAFTLEQRDAQEWTTCYNLQTGEPIWGKPREVRFTEGMSGAGPRSTPFIEGERLYALGGLGDLACRKVADGALIWERNVLGKHGVPIYGMASTPLRVDDLVVVGGGTTGGTLLAFHADTGEPVWRSNPDEEGRYTSPRVAMVAGERLILTTSQMSLTGHDVATGTVRLRIDWPGKIFPKSPQPIVLPGDRIFATASYGMDSFVAEVKPAADGSLSATDLWRRNRMKTKFSSAQVVGNHAYGLDEGIFCCIDLENGDKIWKGGRFGYGQNLLVEDVLLIQSEKGPAILVEPDPTGLKEIARVEALSGKTWNAPSIAGRYLIVRNGKEAICFELPPRSDAP